MLRSMTGHGQALIENDQIRVMAEIKSVNNRFLKTNLHGDLELNLQSHLEGLIKAAISRGSVNLKVKLEHLAHRDSYRVNEAVIRGYWLQLSEIAGSGQHVNLESLLSLPGVVTEKVIQDDSEAWPLIEGAVQQAIEQLQQMREQEGANMLADMLHNCDLIADHLQQIDQLAPQIILQYEQRLVERINSLMEKYQLEERPADVIREVGLFADKADVAEESVRLNSHLKQFREICQATESNGRKLDFLVQEMLRETNTIGSKASNSDIASHVVSIKAIIERIREMVQNVE